MSGFFNDLLRGGPFLEPSMSTASLPVYNFVFIGTMWLVDCSVMLNLLLQLSVCKLSTRL